MKELVMTLHAGMLQKRGSRQAVCHALGQGRRTGHDMLQLLCNMLCSLRVNALGIGAIAQSEAMMPRCEKS